MKHFVALTSVALGVALFLSAGCNVQFSGQVSRQKEEQNQSQQEASEADFPKGDKGKMEQFGEVPPAPGDEEAVQKQEPVQKQSQKQTQKQSKE